MQARRSLFLQCMHVFLHPSSFFQLFSAEKLSSSSSTCNIIRYAVKRMVLRTKRGFIHCLRLRLLNPSALLKKFVIPGHTQVHIILSARPLSQNREHYLRRPCINFCSFGSTALQKRNSPAMCKIKSPLDISYIAICCSQCSSVK